jgi:cation transport regulator ChaB
MSNKKPPKSVTAKSSATRTMFNATALNSAAQTTKNNAKDNDKKALNPSELQGLAKVKWSSMQTDLKSALGSWSDFEQQETVKTPEEEQLDKVKTLIEDLKQKLNDF